MWTAVARSCFSLLQPPRFREFDFPAILERVGEMASRKPAPEAQTNPTL